jgi:hypothetical protein
MVDLLLSGHHPFPSSHEVAALWPWDEGSLTSFYSPPLSFFSFFPVQIFIDRPANNLGNCQPCLSRQTLKPHDL